MALWILLTIMAGAAIASRPFLTYIRDEDKQTLTKTKEEAIYDEVSEFIFQPVRNVARQYLPVKQPIAVEDIKLVNWKIRYSTFYLMGFSLRKLKQEEVEENTLDLAAKNLQVEITKKLRKREREIPGFKAFCKGIPVLCVDEITDMGDYLLIKIGYINNKEIYKYFKNKKSAQPSIKDEAIPDIEDVDF